MKNGKDRITSLRHNMSALVRREKLDGEEHLVVPTILITEGVHNKLMYTADELAKFPQAWDGRPVVLFHPQLNGAPVSANSPELLEQQTVGALYHTTWKGDGKLRSEVWINLAKAQAHEDGKRVLAMLDAGQPVEVSTGLFTEDEVLETAEKWNDDEDYKLIAHNFRPDHLALLPDGKGACSWEDGAGMPRVNAEGDKGLKDQGGAGSGNFGHEGRPGEQGGSGAGGGGEKTPSLYQHRTVERDVAVASLEKESIVVESLLDSGMSPARMRQSIDHTRAIVDRIRIDVVHPDDEGTKLSLRAASSSLSQAASRVRSEVSPQGQILDAVGAMREAISAFKNNSAAAGANAPGTEAGSPPRGVIVKGNTTGDVSKSGEFTGGFDGCVEHMMDKEALPEENARRLCAYIGRRAGKINTADMKTLASAEREWMKRNGGAGFGNFGHAGRPGERGGSSAAGGSAGILSKRIQGNAEEFNKNNSAAAGAHAPGTEAGGAHRTGPGGKQNKGGLKSMERKTRVDSLITNGAWGEADREFLMELEDDVFATVERQAASVAAVVKANAEAVKANGELKDQVKALEAKIPKPITTVEEFVAAAPAPMREVLESGLKAHKDQRDALITAVKANKRNRFTDEQLTAMPMVQLQAVAELASEVDFAGAAGGAAPRTNKEKDEQPDAMPVLAFEAKK